MKINLTEGIEKKINRSKWVKWKFTDLFENIVEKVTPKESGLEHYIGLKHLESGSLKIRRFGKTSDLEGDKQKIYKGDFIFAKRNSYLKRVAIADIDAVASAHSLVLRSKAKNALPEFLPFFLLSELFWKKAIEISVGSLSPTINWKSLAKQEFLLPLKEEQTKLAKLFWSINEMIEADIQLLSKTQSLYLSLIEKELINTSSKKTLFSTLGDVIKGVGYKPNELFDSYDKNSCILLRANNIFNEKINYDDIKILNVNKIKSEQFLQDYDYAICMSNGSKDLVGKSAIYKNNLKNVTIGSFCACFRPKDKYFSDILRHLFASNSYRHIIKKTLSGSAINNLKPSDIESLSLRINFEMKNFNYLIKKLNALSDNKLQIENSIKISKQLLKSTINQIFNVI